VAHGRTHARPTAFGAGTTEDDDEIDSDEHGYGEVDQGSEDDRCAACEKDEEESVTSPEQARARDGQGAPDNKAHRRSSSGHHRTGAGEGGRRSSLTREGDLEATSAPLSAEAGGRPEDEHYYDYSPRIFHTIETSPDDLPRSTPTIAPPPGLLQRTPAAPHRDDDRHG
jgi:hypothetical protein